MSSVTNHLTHGLTLSVSGSYTSPLTVTSTGGVNNNGTGDAIYGASGYA